MNIKRGDDHHPPKKAQAPGDPDEKQKKSKSSRALIQGTKTTKS